MKRKRVCFVTGTRAEFGLMRSVLAAIDAHRGLTLQVVATGMHLDRSRGHTVKDIPRLNAVVPWAAGDRAIATGTVIADLAKVFRRLKTDIVLVVGDRVEAFAAAAAGAISGRVVAHVHGGDRALGQLDDSLRHAISKLSHIHFPATVDSARRLQKLGEDRFRIHRVGSPGIDGITRQAASFKSVASLFPGLRPRAFALVALHPVDADDQLEAQRARQLLTATAAAGIASIVVIDPNNDPGAEGIRQTWRQAEKQGRIMRRSNVPRDIFLGLLRDAAVLVGNSSSGIIEAASFGTPVVDVGPRQLGRQRGKGVRNVRYGITLVRRAVAHFWDGGRAPRGKYANPYAHDGYAGLRIARILGGLSDPSKLLAKLITY
jgi:GDP/UDP-N,N'-diacetylbacillosamine 2-epimerase (hydrolysing)